MNSVFLKIILLSLGLLPHLLKGQMKVLEKVFVVEGIIADKETFEIIPSAIIFNDTLGITTISDENGYFKIVVPYKLVIEKQYIQIDIVKTGYKRNGWGISSFQLQKEIDTFKQNVSWNYDVQILLMAKNESSESSSSMAHIPSKENTHGYHMIKLALEQAINSEKRNRKLEQLKSGNENVYFHFDKWIIFATGSSSAYLETKPIVFINGKKSKLSNLNKELKRSKTKLDWKESAELETKYKKYVIAFRTFS
ncbi:hypothetical protein [Ferruginibacter sp.]